MKKIVDTTVEEYEYPMSFNTFKEQLKLRGAERHIFEIMAFLFTKEGARPDIICDRWFIVDKLHMLTDPNNISSEMNELKKVLSKLKPGFITSIDYKLVDSDLYIYINTIVGTIGIDGSLAKMSNISDSISFTPNVKYSVK